MRLDVIFAASARVYGKVRIFTTVTEALSCWFGLGSLLVYTSRFPPPKTRLSEIVPQKHTVRGI